MEDICTRFSHFEITHQHTEAQARFRAAKRQLKKSQKFCSKSDGAVTRAAESRLDLEYPSWREELCAQDNRHESGCTIEECQPRQAGTDDKGKTSLAPQAKLTDAKSKYKMALNDLVKAEKQLDEAMDEFNNARRMLKFAEEVLTIKKQQVSN